MERFTFNAENYLKHATTETTFACTFETFYAFLGNDRAWPSRAELFAQSYVEKYPQAGCREDNPFERFCYEIQVIVYSFRYRPDLLETLFGIAHLPLQYAIHNIADALIEQDAVEIMELYKERGYPLKVLSILRPSSFKSVASVFDMTNLLHSMPSKRPKKVARRHRRTGINYLARLLQREDNAIEVAQYIVQKNALATAEFYRDELIISNSILFECAFQARNLTILRSTLYGFNVFKDDKERDIIYLAEAMHPDTGPEDNQNHVILYDNLRKLYEPEVEEKQRAEVLRIAERNRNYPLWLYLR